MSQSVVHKTIRIKAEPDKVWDALTNPEKTKKYFFHCKVYSDWNVGDPITFKGRIFLIKKIEMRGTILKITPGKLLQYQLKNNNGTEGTSTVTDSLTYEDGETLVSITDDVGQQEGVEKRYERSLKGWDKILTGLKKVVEEAA